MADTDSERQGTVRLEDYLRVARERLWVVIVAIVIVAGVAVAISLTTTPLYTASAGLVYEKNDLDTAVSGFGLHVYDYEKDRTIATALAAISSSESMAEAVKDQLGRSEPASTFKGMVSARSSEGSDLVSIAAVSTDPYMAADVANAYADQFVIYRRDTDRATVAAAREVVREQIESLSAADLQSEYGLMLQEKSETLRILEAMQDGGFRVVRLAAVPGSPYTPRTTRNVILGVLVGLIVGIGVALLLEYLDKRIKDEKTLERLSGLPVLASVPAIGGKWLESKRGKGTELIVGFEGPRSALLESFRTLRSSLQYFEVSQPLRTIVVTSGLPKEGKTVTTINLAVSLALSGKRVVVLEADLRLPRVAEYLGLENEVGLSSVLSGQSSVASALQLVIMDPLSCYKGAAKESECEMSPLHKNLYCMTSGPLPPNPAELLGTARMGQVISELAHMADYVLIDTPPLIPVSDALILAGHVDAVVVTARLHSSTRGEIEEVRDMLRKTGARAIGVVAKGMKAKRGHYYRHGYDYGHGYQ